VSVNTVPAVHIITAGGPCTQSPQSVTKWSQLTSMIENILVNAFTTIGLLYRSWRMLGLI